MNTTATQRTRYISLDERTRTDPDSVRAAIYNRSSDPGAKPEDVIEQRLQCEEFVARMGWPPVPDSRVFMDAKTGMRNVQRPNLEQLLALCARGEIHVIVSREMARVARNAELRYEIIGKADHFGVEWRFANLAPDGKLPKGIRGRTEQFLVDVKAEGEAETIVERLTHPRERRYAQGLPHGGRNGPLYGYAPGVRGVGKGGRPKGLLTWVINPEQERWVKWMFNYVDQADPHTLSQRALASELDRLAPTATGTGHWSSKQVTNLLTNPKYCGQGRSLRYKTGHEQFRDLETFIKFDESLPTVDRMRDPEQWGNLPPIPETAIPRIIEPDQFERVQANLRAAADLKNRGGPRRFDAEAHPTLLDDGYARCGYTDEDGHVCGGKMTRYWHLNSKHAYYHHSPRAGTPNATHGHRTNQVQAHVLEAQAMRLLARALTDPQKLLELADAAEAQQAAATTEAELASATLAVYTRRMGELDAEQKRLSTALTALSAVPGMEQSLAEIRAKLATLDQARRDAEAERTQAIPRRDHALERQALLARIARHQHIKLDRVYDENWNLVEDNSTHTGPLILNHDISPEAAADLLGVQVADLPVRVRREPIYVYPYYEGDSHVIDVFEDVETARVIYYLLRKAPRERVRKLLRDLGAVIYVRPPRPRAEWATRGITPIADRVYLELLGSVQVRIDAANFSRFS